MPDRDRTLPPSTHAHTGVREDLVKKILECGAKEAESCNRGDFFILTWNTKTVPKGIHFHQIITQVQEQSSEYGLLPGTCFDWKFEFLKL